MTRRRGTAPSNELPPLAMIENTKANPAGDIRDFIEDRPDEMKQDSFQNAAAGDMPCGFIVGKVVIHEDKEYLMKGAKVTLKTINGPKAMETTTDNFGMFEFQHLHQGMTYSVKIEVPGYKTTEFTVGLDEAKNMGIITLEKVYN
ncbi:MAG: carboxypeptidase-like regulatory domain-containing protein [Oscillospiraceae bacterium]